VKDEVDTQHARMLQERQETDPYLQRMKKLKEQQQEQIKAMLKNKN